MNKHRLKHAQHNNETCNYLLHGGSHNDWVVTVAFYSAIHFFRYKIFPLEFNNGDTSLNSFEDFCNSFNIRDKHKALENLVKKFTDREIYMKFRSLKNECWTCRYSNFNVKEERAKEAYTDLAEISKYCSSKKTNIVLDSKKALDFN